MGVIQPTTIHTPYSPAMRAIIVAVDRPPAFGSRFAPVGQRFRRSRRTVAEARGGPIPLNQPSKAARYTAVARAAHGRSGRTVALSPANRIHGTTPASATNTPHAIGLAYDIAGEVVNDSDATAIVSSANCEWARPVTIHAA